MTDIERYQPTNAQEENDRRIILQYAAHFPENILLRENEIAHITSSGFIMNESLDKTLMVHHNIRGVWAWTGGHADGDPDLRRVALREAAEETGLTRIRCLFEDIASIDIGTVEGHIRKGRYVSAHLHLNTAYLLIADENEPPRVKPDENTAVAWFDIEKIKDENFSPFDVYLYNKLIQKARDYRRVTG